MPLCGEVKQNELIECQRERVVPLSSNKAGLCQLGASEIVRRSCYNASLCSSLTWKTRPSTL